MRIARAMDDNPFFYKDMTQWLRRDMFLLFLFALPGISTLAAFYVCFDSDIEPDERGFFLAIAVALSLFCYLLVLAASIAFVSAEENRSRTIELFHIAGITPPGMVARRLWASMAESSVGLLSALPFLGIALLLGGADMLLLIVVVIGCVFLAPLAFLIAVNVAFSNTASNRSKKSQVLPVILIFITGYMLFFGLVHLLDSGTFNKSWQAIRNGVPPHLSGWSVATALAFYGGLVALLFCSACSMAGKPYESYRGWTRLAWLWLALAWLAAVGMATKLAPGRLYLALGPLLSLIASDGLMGVYGRSLRGGRHLFRMSGKLAVLGRLCEPTPWGALRFAILLAGVAGLYAGLCRLVSGPSDWLNANLTSGIGQIFFFLAFPGGLLIFVKPLRRRPQGIATAIFAWWLLAGAAGGGFLAYKTGGLAHYETPEARILDKVCLLLSPFSAAVAAAQKSPLADTAPWWRFGMGIAGLFTLAGIARRMSRYNESVELSAPLSSHADDRGAFILARRPRWASASPVRPPVSGESSWAGRLWEGIDNAMLYRDTTQWLRRRTFPMLLFGLLGISATAVAGVTLSEPADASGSPLFGILVAVIVGYGLLLAVLYGQNAKMEVVSRTHELIEIAGMPAERIVWGRMSALMVQFLFGFLTVVPFLFIAYLFGGLSFLKILLFAGGGLLLVPQLSLSLVALSQPRRDRSASGLGELTFVLAVFCPFLLFFSILSGGAALYNAAPGNIAMSRVWAGLLLFLPLYASLLLTQFFGACEVFGVRTDWREGHIKVLLVITTLLWLLGMTITTAGVAGEGLLIATVTPVILLMLLMGMNGFLQCADGPSKALERERMAPRWARWALRLFPSGSRGSLRALWTICGATVLCGGAMAAMRAWAGNAISWTLVLTMLSLPVQVFYYLAFPLMWFRMNDILKYDVSKLRNTLVLFWAIAGFLDLVLLVWVTDGFAEYPVALGVFLDLIGLLVSPLSGAVAAQANSPLWPVAWIVRTALGIFGIVVTHRLAGQFGDWRTMWRLKCEQREKVLARLATRRLKRIQTSG